MENNKFNGEYTKAFVSETPISSDSIDFKHIDVKPNEATYIYSFKENKMLFVKGFEELLGIKDEELDLIKVMNSYDPEYAKVIFEINDKTLHYMHHNKRALYKKTLLIINFINEKNEKIQILREGTIYETDNSGNFVSIKANFRRIKGLKTNNIIQYAIVSNKKIEGGFFYDINFNLEANNSISYYEIRILEALENKMSYSEIGEKYNCPENKIRNIVSNLFIRFKSKNRDELVQFAIKNHLLPNQFEQNNLI